MSAALVTPTRQDGRMSSRARTILVIAAIVAVLAGGITALAVTLAPSNSSTPLDSIAPIVVEPSTPTPSPSAPPAETPVPEPAPIPEPVPPPAPVPPVPPAPPGDDDDDDDDGGDDDFDDGDD